MKSLKLNIISLTLLVTLSVPVLAQEPQSVQDKFNLNDNTNESFILLPGTADKDGANTDVTSKTSPFPAFFLLDTTLSTLVVDEVLSIQVELRKVDFFSDGRKDSARHKNEMVLLPRPKAVTIPSMISSKKIHL